MTPDQIRKLAAREGYQQHHEKPLEIPPPEVEIRGATQRHRLRWHLDARGSLIELHRESWHSFHHLPQDAPTLGHVGQAYVSTTIPGVVKGWHLHAHQTDRFVCLRGRLLLATCEIDSSDPHVNVQILEPMRGACEVIVPPGIAHGWRALGEEEAWVLNLCSHEYTGTDEWRRAAHEGPTNALAFAWDMEIDG
jgi:dTDP-4-dehydrorhamnose 3,5-epimerase